MKKLIGVIVFLAVLSIVIYLVTLVTKEPSRTTTIKETPGTRRGKLENVKSDLWNSAT